MREATGVPDLSQSEIVTIVALSAVGTLLVTSYVYDKIAKKVEARACIDASYYARGFNNEPLEWKDDQRELRHAEEHWKRGAEAARAKQSAEWAFKARMEALVQNEKSTREAISQGEVPPQVDLTGRLSVVDDDEEKLHE